MEPVRDDVDNARARCSSIIPKLAFAMLATLIVVVSGGCGASTRRGAIIDEGVVGEHFGKAGGRLVLTEVNGRTIALTQSGVVSFEDGIVDLERTLPGGYDLVPEGVLGEFAALRSESDPGSIAIWDLDALGGSPMVLSVEGQVIGLLAVDIVDDPAPEFVLVVNEMSIDTESAKGDHEIVQVWSVRDGVPVLLRTFDPVGAGKTSIIGKVVAVDAGSEDQRPELVWREIDATGGQGADAYLVVVDPTRDFAICESGRFDRGLGIAGAREDASGVSLLLKDWHSEDALVARAQDGSCVILDRADAYVWAPVLSTEQVTGRPAPVPARCSSGIRLEWLDQGHRSPVDVTLPDGERLVIEAEEPLLAIDDVGLVDLEGDGVTELLVTAQGEPVLCSDTNTAFVGIAHRGADGAFEQVRWSAPLRGGLAGLDVGDIDGVPGDEIVVGICDTFCSGVPSGLWVFGR